MAHLSHKSVTAPPQPILNVSLLSVSLLVTSTTMAHLTHGSQDSTPDPQSGGTRTPEALNAGLTGTLPWHRHAAISGDHATPAVRLRTIVADGTNPELRRLT